MISRESLSLDYITSKNHEFNGDPIIIEKVIRALVLLEKLRVEKLDFIFKGGYIPAFSYDPCMYRLHKQLGLDSILDF